MLSSGYNEALTHTCTKAGDSITEKYLPFTPSVPVGAAWAMDSSSAFTSRPEAVASQLCKAVKKAKYNKAH